MGTLIAAAPHRNELSINWRRDCLVGSRFAFFMEVITRPHYQIQSLRAREISSSPGLEPAACRVRTVFLAAFGSRGATITPMTSMRLKDQPLSERPRERLAALGPEAL